MHRTAQLDTITRIITSRIPGAQPADVRVHITESLAEGSSHSWEGTPRGLAGIIYAAMSGSIATLPDSPLAQAQNAKRSRDLAGEVGALMAGMDALEAAPWYPSRPGDLVHIGYSASGIFEAYGETYVIEQEDGSAFLNMRLLHHSAALGPEFESMVGCYAVEGADQPLAEPWFEAGPARITVVRDGSVIPNQAV
jgi:hypothetical protein